MPSREVEELFRNLAFVHRVSSVAEAKASRKARISRFFNRERIREMFKKSTSKPHSAAFFRREPVKVPFTARKRDHRGDLTVAALGLTLGLICALFPWYIFYNPQQFGVRAMKFSRDGEVGQTGPITLGSQPERVGALDGRHPARTMPQRSTVARSSGASSSRSMASQSRPMTIMPRTITSVR